MTIRVYDSVQQLMLLDPTIKGKRRKVITQASKNGFFWVLDRVTGEFISGAPYVKTNWASGLDPNGRPIVNPEAYYDAEPISLFLTGGGAYNWSPMSWNPATGYRSISPCPATPSPMRRQKSLNRAAMDTGAAGATRSRSAGL